MHPRICVVGGVTNRDELWGAILVKLRWRHWGAGRALARGFSVDTETGKRSPVRVAAFAMVRCGMTGSSYTKLRMASGQSPVLTLRLASCETPSMAHSSNHVPPQNVFDGCYSGNRGARKRIEPKTSRMTCREAKATLVVVPNAVGTWNAISRNPVNKTATRWLCREYPRADYPLEVRCETGGRHFEVVGVGRQSG